MVMSSMRRRIRRRVDEKCDFDGSELYQRDDDKAETVKNRIKVYLEQTSPLISYYRDHGKLVEIDGTQSIDQVTEDLLAALKSSTYELGTSDPYQKPGRTANYA